jgi:hypothetical protein
MYNVFLSGGIKNWNYFVVEQVMGRKSLTQNFEEKNVLDTWLSRDFGFEVV